MKVGVKSYPIPKRIILIGIMQELIVDNSYTFKKSFQVTYRSASLPASDGGCYDKNLPALYQVYELFPYLSNQIFEIFAR